jgi:hypothetical protein
MDSIILMALPKSAWILLKMLGKDIVLYMNGLISLIEEGTLKNTYSLAVFYFCGALDIAVMLLQ